MIPKIIHYCWLSNDPIPENLQSYLKTWKEKLPGYEFKLWNFDCFDKNSSLWVSQAFDNKKYAFAADYIRLYAVYNFGGFYLDMDIQVLKSFDDLLNNEICLAFENDEKNGIEAGCFGAEKGNKIIGECLEYYKNRSFIKSDGTFDILTLPKIMFNIISKYKEIKIQDRFTFTCKSYSTGIIETKETSYAIHNFAGSWLSNEDKNKNEYRYELIKKYGDSVISKVLYALFCLKERYRKNGFCKASGFYFKKYILRRGL